MAKRSRAFENSLAFISIFGFITIGLSGLFDINISEFQTSFLMLVAGFALLIEGQILTFRKWGRDGINGNEAPLILTLVVGLTSVIVGILALPMLNLVSVQLNTITAMVAFFAAAFVAYQWWFD